MKTMFILIGPPGIGKSTWIQKNWPETPILSTDYFTEQVAKENGVTYDDIFDEGYRHLAKERDRRYNQRIQQLQQLNSNFVVDRTNLTVKARQKLMRQFPKHNPIAVLFEYDSLDNVYQNCQNRSKQIIKTVSESVFTRFINSYTPPTLEEGFSKILIIPPFWNK